MHFIQTYLYKILCITLLFYTFWAGLLLPVPALPILHESIRNLYFHVPMWFGMVGLLFASFIYSIKYLNTQKTSHDLYAKSLVESAFYFGIIGITTGSVWAKFTWGKWWVSDPKLNGAAIGMLVYLAYFILRNFSENKNLVRRFSAVYNIFGFVMFIIFIFVLPRMTDSLHPGNGGNPGFSQYDLDSGMRLVFYPAVLGFLLLGFWITNLLFRYELLKEKKDEAFN